LEARRPDTNGIAGAVRVKRSEIIHLIDAEIYFEDLKAEIIDAKQLAIEANGTVLVWTGEPSRGAGTTPTDAASNRSAAAANTPSLTLLHVKEWGRGTRSDVSDERERRQLTVMFCEVVGSTALSEQFDREEPRISLAVH
jgi:hypothetical protein